MLVDFRKPRHSTLLDHRGDFDVTDQIARPQAKDWSISASRNFIRPVPSSIWSTADLKVFFHSLRDGRSIHTVSALLLQLVQTSAHDVRLQARNFARKRRELNAQQSMTSVVDAKEHFLSTNDLEV